MVPPSTELSGHQLVPPDVGRMGAGGGALSEWPCGAGGMIKGKILNWKIHIPVEDTSGMGIDIQVKSENSHHPVMIVICESFKSGNIVHLDLLISKIDHKT